MPTSDAQFEALHRKAHAAGMAAMEATVPEPMVVGKPTHPLGSNIDPSKGPVYFVPGGVCGFAWVNMPGTTGFARWAKARGLARKAYEGGYNIRVRAGGQSYEMKMAYAGAYAQVLQEAGLKRVYANGRLD